MKTNIDEGRIVKALAGFYYIDDGHEVHQCRARGKFRKQDIKPVVGDFVEFQKGNHDDGYLLRILERKNVLRRPPIANIDQALLVFSRKEPDFSTVLLVLLVIYILYPLLKLNLQIPITPNKNNITTLIMILFLLLINPPYYHIVVIIS